MQTTLDTGGKLRAESYTTLQMSRDDTALLSEMMLQSEVFCNEIAWRTEDTPPTSEKEELRLRLGQCRGALAQLQTYHNANLLKISEPLVRADFRTLVISLLWLAFRAAPQIDFKLYRKLIQIESGFTYLLNIEAGRKH
jgi:hypothetical protein